MMGAQLLSIDFCTLLAGLYLSGSALWQLTRGFVVSVEGWAHIPRFALLAIGIKT